MGRPAEPRFHPTRKRWYARCGERGPDGKRRQVYAPETVVTKAEAWAWLREAEAQQGKAKAVDARLTVATLLESYLAWAELEAGAGRMARATYAVKALHLSRFAEYAPPALGHALADKTAADLGVEELQGFVRSLQGAGYSPHYIHDIIASVQAALNWAARPIAERVPARLLPGGNPFAGYKTDVVIERTDRYVEAGDIEAFLEWAWKDARRLSRVRRRFAKVFVLMLRFLRETGCRPGEAAAARWERVDWAKATLTVPEWKNKKKTGRDRLIHLTAPVLRILRVLHRLKGRHPEFVFTHLRGKGSVARGGNPLHGEPWGSVAAMGYRLRKLRDAAAKAGVPVATRGARRLTAYLLRHTYGADAKMAGLGDHEAAELMGTSAEVFRETYGRVQVDHARKVAEDLAARRRPGA